MILALGTFNGDTLIGTIGVLKGITWVHIQKFITDTAFQMLLL